MLKNNPIEQLSASNLTYIRDYYPVFQGIQLTLSAGELLHIQGENGSGKTTLLRMLAGLISCDMTLMVNGRKVSSMIPWLQSEKCYIGHKNAIKHYLTVAENLRCGALQFGKVLLEADVHKIAVKFALQTLLQRQAITLSFGQQKKLSLLRLLISDSQWWLLDEPFVGLDQDSQTTLLSLMDAHCASGGIVIFTSHHEVARPFKHSCQSLSL